MIFNYLILLTICVQREEQDDGFGQHGDLGDQLGDLGDQLGYQGDPGDPI